MPLPSTKRSQDSVVGIENNLRAWQSGLRIRRRQDVFLFPKTSRPILGPIQPTIQWIPGFFPGQEWQRHDADNSPPSSTEVKNERSYIPITLIRLHGVDSKLHLYFNSPLKPKRWHNNSQGTLETEIYSQHLPYASPLLCEKEIHRFLWLR
jgi:hypothetical protein